MSIINYKYVKKCPVGAGRRKRKNEVRKGGDLTFFKKIGKNGIIRQNITRIDSFAGKKGGHAWMRRLAKWMGQIIDVGRNDENRRRK